MKGINLIYIFCFAFFQSGLTQVDGNDSLVRILINQLRTSKDDTSKCNILIRLADEADDASLAYYNEMLGDFCETHIKLYPAKSELYNFYEIAYASYLYNIANLKIRQGAYLEANEIVEKALKLNSLQNDPANLGGIYDLYGRVKFFLGEFKSSIDYTTRAISIFRKLKKPDLEIGCLNVLGVIYSSCGDLESALKNHREVYQMQINQGEVGESASILMNIGSIFYKKGAFDSAYVYCQKAISILKEFKNMKGLAEGYNNLGILYMHQKNFDMAITYLDSSVAINEKLQLRHSLAENYKTLGKIYYGMSDFKKSEYFALKSAAIAKENGMKKMLLNSALILYKLYKKEKKYQSALEYYLLAMEINDSLTNIENKKASMKSQLKYEYEKKAAADSVKAAEEKKVTEAQLKQEKTQRLALYGGLGLIGLFALFMVNRFRVTNKQKKLIEEQKRVVEQQKHLVEEKQKEILDSIHYAKRIQTALISSEHYMQKNLKRLN